MTSLIKQILLHLVVISIVLSSGCSDDENVVDPGDRLCGGASGLAARIAGAPGITELCVSNKSTTTIYTPPGAGIPAGRYETVSVYTADSLTIEISTMFYEHAGGTQPLSVTGNRAQAEFDPDGLWFYYREIKNGAYDFTSSTVVGAATFTFGDPTVAVVTFANLDISLEDTATKADAGTRMISEGYLNVTAD